MGDRAVTTTTAEPVSDAGTGVPQFSRTLAGHGLKLVRSRVQTLQVNVGLVCNQVCGHCHLDAGPGRRETMSAETVEQVAAFAERCRFQSIDITGGAPELNPNIETLVRRLAPATPRLMIRSNLSLLDDGDHERLLDLLRNRQVVIITSLPSINASQTESQRGKGLFETSIAALRRLNGMGYGKPESGLELNLVSNPTGAFLPQGQEQTEARFRRVLENRHGVVFNNLFSFANVPLGRFRRWLLSSGNYQSYIRQLSDKFNACAVEGVMCRTLVSVAWDGILHDCDFNIAAGLPLANRRVHVSELDAPPAPGSMIATADHCYACTAGSGFT